MVFTLKPFRKNEEIIVWTPKPSWKAQYTVDLYERRRRRSKLQRRTYKRRKTVQKGGKHNRFFYHFLTETILTCL
jgi:hypothetical protein